MGLIQEQYDRLRKKIRKSEIENLRRAERATGRNCRILMDLAGPKLRTGPLAPDPAVVKIRRPEKFNFAGFEPLPTPA